MLWKLRRSQEDFLKDTGHFSDQELKKTHTYKSNGLWNNSAEMMMRESGHLYSEQQVHETKDLSKAKRRKIIDSPQR